MRLTIRSNQALRVLMVCAVNQDTLLRSADIAQTCKASEHHMAQIIHRLARLGYITSVRGRSGGVKLSRPPSEIVIGEVIRNIESEFPFVECFDPKGCECPIADVCTLRGHFEVAIEAFYAVLDNVTLAQITEDNNHLAKRFLMLDVA